MTVQDAPALLGETAPSPAGPLPDADAHLPAPPVVALSRTRTVLQFNQRQIEFVFRARRLHGEVFRFRGMIPGGPVITGHPDHVRSLFTAAPDLAPSLTAESPLRPIVGPNSTLTANGPQHLRQRKLLLPPFHGEAIERYTEMIADVTERELDRWPIGEPFALAPRMQAITLDVIMAGIFGIEGRPARGSAEHRLRVVVRWLTEVSTWPVAMLAELRNVGSDEPVGLTKRAMGLLDAAVVPIIRGRRSADLTGRHDILSLLLQARTEQGEPLSTRHLRDELLTLVLAGHETTANQLAWAWERLVRAPDAHERLREAVLRGGDEVAAEVAEATLVEAMRSRPVIPAVGRRVAVPWRLGDVAVPAGTPVMMSILLVHHREDRYPDPFAFRPERWLGGRRPGTYDWIPFGGGTRRCLGAALAMAEQRVVLSQMARRLDLVAAEPAPERAQHRNVTMIPARGGRVVVRSRAPA